MLLYRITTWYDETLQPILNATTRLQLVSKKKECLYVMANGSFILTRKDNCKELKLGKIFMVSNFMQIEGKDNYIKASQYVSHLGNCKILTQKIEQVLDDCSKLNDKLIFITYGVTSLRKWTEDYYHRAIFILDF